MPTFTVAWNPLTKVAVVQAEGESLPIDSIVAGTFVDNNVIQIDNLNHVLYHQVREVLRSIGYTSMHLVSIQLSSESTSQILASALLVGDNYLLLNLSNLYLKD